MKRAVRCGLKENISTVKRLNEETEYKTRLYSSFSMYILHSFNSINTQEYFSICDGSEAQDGQKAAVVQSEGSAIQVLL